jgi:DNA repair exonuclease SbcCD ATPase subunit
MIMKVTKLTIHNIGKIGDTTIQLDKPLILFYGEIRQGKTTILNAVRWVCGGEFPQDIISHGKDEAHIELEFDGGMISRSWYRTKDETKTTKSRPVVFIRGGKPVASPVAEIKRFLNPFLINQDHLREKSELERKQFFTELFAVDTSELDKEWFNNDREASNLRIAIKSYGEIDLTPVERVNDDALKAELQRVRDAHAAKRRQLEGQLATIGKAYDAELDRVEAANEAARLVNVGIDQKKQSLKSITEQIAALETRLANLKAEKEAVAKWLKETPEAKLLSRPAAPNTDDIKREILDSPDTSELEQRIQQAGATNVRAEQYEANKKRADEKKAKEDAVSKLEARQREIKREKQAKLKTVSDSCGIKDLAFDGAGNFIYQNTEAGMLSTSQIMRLSSELSAMYPDGFGLELLDRGESLGKSIFEFVDRAKAENKTILATIVGERPAKVPANIGVFVVTNGTAIEQA